MITFRRLYAQCQSPLPHCSFLMPTQVLKLLTGFQYLRLFLVPVFVCNKSVTQNSKFKTWIRVHSANSRDYYAPWRLGLFLLSCDHRFQTLIVCFGDQIVSPIFRFNLGVTLVASYLEWFDWNTRVFIRDAWWLDSVYWLQTFGLYAGFQSGGGGSLSHVRYRDELMSDLIPSWESSLRM